MIYKIGQTVAVHYKKDPWHMDHFFDYPEYGEYRKLKVINAKRHWFFLFEKVFLLSDGHWYQEKQITPIIRVYGY